MTPTMLFVFCSMISSTFSESELWFSLSDTDYPSYSVISLTRSSCTSVPTFFVSRLNLLRSCIKLGSDASCCSSSSRILSSSGSSPPPSESISSGLFSLLFLFLLAALLFFCLYFLMNFQRTRFCLLNNDSSSLAYSNSIISLSSYYLTISASLYKAFMASCILMF